MPSIRLLDLTNLVALSPANHFFNGLLAGILEQQLEDVVGRAGNPGDQTAPPPGGFPSTPT